MPPVVQAAPPEWWAVRSHHSWYANETWESKPIDSVGKEVSGRWVQPQEMLRIDVRFWDAYYSGYCVKLHPVADPRPQIEPTPTPKAEPKPKAKAAAPKPKAEPKPKAKE